jgi:diguanylate cyclase (GGDEF)-like protein
MAKKKQQKSIQRQYSRVAVILGTLVVSLSILIASGQIHKTSELTGKVEQASGYLRSISNIKNHFSSLQGDIDKFMLEPERSSYDTVFDNTIGQLKRHISLLQQNLAELNSPGKSLLDSIDRSLDHLTFLIERLKKTRLDANSQFPALGVSAEVMRPTRNIITNTFSTLISEYIDNDVINRDPDVFNTLIGAQKLWLSTVSEYRLYLANRLGSFAEQGLIAQEDLIDTYLDELSQTSQELMEKNDGETFGFEGGLLITDLLPNIEKWHSGFTRVKEINHSDNWRQDTKLMSNHIIPQISESLKYLEEVETEIQNLIASDLNALSKVGTNLIFVLGAVIAFFLLYVAASIYSLKRLVIQPIAEISQTLKNNAIGKTRLFELDINTTTETQDLIDAFSEMEKQVFLRQNKLEEQALNDSLTGLPNRLMLQDRLDYQIKVSVRDNQPFSFMMLDLNHFKEVNDTLGHHIGDQLLIQVGTRLKDAVRDTDTVARLGGDEFAILLPGTSREFAALIARKISKAITTPFLVHSYSLNISTSIGITEYPNDAGDRNILVQYADVAMYCSKRSKDEFCYYDANIDDYSVDRLSLVSDLRHAIKNNELSLYYQPKFDLKSMQLIGAEALLRWERRNQGFISPELIVDTAEKAGLIDDLSFWVLRRTGQDSKIFQEINPALRLSVNLAVQNLRNKNLHLEVQTIIDESGLNPAKITLEITEHGMMTNPEQSIGILNELDRMGLTLSIDDFGTGFSSLSYLKQLPVSELKIDKSFIIDMLNDESDRQIVNSTIQLAHSLGLDVTAEGVENREILDLIRDMGCDSAQGYFMSKPLVIEAFIDYLKNTPQF